jgi:predicted Zn finger-like uncharacterized protein
VKVVLIGLSFAACPRTIAARPESRMRIVCPSCEATYEVPKSLLGDGGKLVRCARCGKEWLPEATPPAEAPSLSIATTLAELRRMEQPSGASVVDKAPQPVDAAPRLGGSLGERLASRSRQPASEDAMPDGLDGVALRVNLLSRRMQLVSALAWAGSAVVLVAAAATFVAKQSAIQVLFPATERLYRLFGMS